MKWTHLHHITPHHITNANPLNKKKDWLQQRYSPTWVVILGAFCWKCSRKIWKLSMRYDSTPGATLKRTAHCRGVISQGSRWNWVAMEWIDMKGGKKRSAKNWGKNPELELSKKQCHVGIVGMCFFSFCWYRKATRFRDPKCWDNPHVVKYEHCFQTPSSWYCWKLVVCLSSCKNLWNSTFFQSEKPEQWSSEKNPESWNYWRFWTSNQIIRENSAKGTYFNLGCSPLPVVKVFSRFFRFGLDQNEKLKNSDLSLFQHPKTINSNASPSYSDF